MPKSLPRQKTAWPGRPKVACSWGDVFDRWTILNLKARKIADPAKRGNVNRELAAVGDVIGDLARFPTSLTGLVNDLMMVNEALWSIEEGKRACERDARFDAAFVALARSVYLENDRRARIKKAINLLLGSDIVEEKSYPDPAPVEAQGDTKARPDGALVSTTKPSERSRAWSRGRRRSR